MADRIPSGTRDVLPDEMRELRALTDRMHTVFDAARYGEIYTPALEYERTFVAPWTSANPAYRMFDQHGNTLVLRSDMTVPIARVVGTRYAQSQTPLRFSYFAHSYRDVRPQRGQSREFLQAGVELVGMPAPEGTAEVLTVLCDALDAAGLQNYRVGLGSVSLYPSLLTTLGVGPEPSDRILAALAAGDFVEVGRELAGLELSGGDRALLEQVPQMRGGPELLDGLPGPLHEAGAGLRGILARLAPRTADRVIFDFGLVRSLGYYTGAVFQVYDPAYGVPLGGGGRYDELLGHFGRPMPAAGFALNVERVHIALTGEEQARA